MLLAKFFHAMPEEKIGAPLGYGSTLYFFTYRDSIHPSLGQFLVTRGETPNAAKLLREYFVTSPAPSNAGGGASLLR